MSVPLIEKDVVTETNSNQSNNNRYLTKVVINNRRFHCHRGLQKTFVHYWYKLLIFLKMSCFCLSLCLSNFA